MTLPDYANTTSIRPVQGQLDAHNAKDIEAFIACWADDCEYYAFPINCWRPRQRPCASVMRDYAAARSAAVNVCSIKVEIVIGPTPPGTGVHARQRAASPVASISPMPPG